MSASNKMTSNKTKVMHKTDQYTRSSLSCNFLTARRGEEVEDRWDEVVLAFGCSPRVVR